MAKLLGGTTVAGTLTATGAITGSNLIFVSGKTLSVNNSLTLSGADASTLNIGSGGTLGTLAYQSGTFSGTSSGTNTGDQTITLTGEVTGSGTGSFTTTLSTSAVVGKTLSGFSSNTGTITTADTIVGAISNYMVIMPQRPL